MSAGSRSGVNCTRRKTPENARASALASVVLPTPGTSSMQQVLPGEQRHQHVVDRLGLAEDHALELRAQLEQLQRGLAHHLFTW